MISGMEKLATVDYIVKTFYLKDLKQKLEKKLIKRKNIFSGNICTTKHFK